MHYARVSEAKALGKSYLGPRLRRLREERGLTQLAIAKGLGVSPSYYNQLENNQRPLTVPLLAKVSSLFGVDAQFFAEDDEGRLLADLREALSMSAPQTVISATELREFAGNHPALARAVLTIHGRQRAAVERADALAHALAERGGVPNYAPPLTPHEEVRDFFYARNNYIAALDQLAERIAADMTQQPGDTLQRLVDRLENKHGVQIETEHPHDGVTPQRSYDPETRSLRVPLRLLPGQRAFQLATQIGFLEARAVIYKIAEEGAFSTEEARGLARLGLAHHFAGALLMPYGAFHEAAERLRYDIDRLRRQFHVSYETACHRLSTLQRPDKKGVPFFFMRVDRAGNISKRQSATDFHFSRVGGTCPLWNVYEAFAQPGRVLRQLAQMPDGRVYLWIARAVSRSSSGFGSPDKTFAIGLGCDLGHAHRLVYAEGLDLKNPQTATPIGMGCKVCERSHCPQRAFPPLGHKLDVDENETLFEPYPFR